MSDAYSKVCICYVLFMVVYFLLGSLALLIDILHARLATLGLGYIVFTGWSFFCTSTFINR